MDCSTPGLPVLHHLLGLVQTHVHWVSDAIQPSHPLSSPSPLPFNLSKHQDLSNELAVCIRWSKYLSFSFRISPPNEHSGLFPLEWTGWICLQSKGLSRVFSNTTVQKHQFFNDQFLYSPTLTFVPDYYLKAYRAKIGFAEKKMTFGKHLRMGADCQENQPCNYQNRTFTPIPRVWGKGEDLGVGQRPVIKSITSV